MNPTHVWLVVAQEFRIRLRTGRWRWLLGAWVVVLAAFTLLLDAGLPTGYGIEEDRALRGVPLFGFLMFFVLGCMLVISPALASQTINGDRERGTLATLQVTRLRPFEIALGKLLAAWAVGLVALALSVPFAVYAMYSGGITGERMAAVYGVVALLIGTYCAIAQALSALLARSITSALLSYVVTAAMAVGTLLAFLLAQPLVEERRHVPTPYGGYITTEDRSDRIWWLLAPNPFVVLADAAPRVPPKITVNGEIYRYENYDPLSAISNEVRRLRLRPEERYPWQYEDQINYVDGVPAMPVVVEQRDEDELAVWPFGLGFSVLLLAASLAVTTVRLRAPARRLAKGVRVA